MKNIINVCKNYVSYLKNRDALVKNPMHDDIYIVEFPKSGITWLSFIIGNAELLLSNKKNEKITFYNIHKYVPDVHQMRGSYARRFLNRTFVKSHAEYNPSYYFVIYLMRNPFDVMVSYYNFMKNEGLTISFEEFVKNEKYGIQKWKNHVNSWMHKRDNAQRMHLIKYEDLMSDSEIVIRNLYKNLGIVVSDDILEKSLDNSSVTKMKLSENFLNNYNPNYHMAFVGKENKIPKSELMTDNIKGYIFSEAKDQIEEFYPDYVRFLQ